MRDKYPQSNTKSRQTNVQTLMQPNVKISSILGFQMNTPCVTKHPSQQQITSIELKTQGTTHSTQSSTRRGSNFKRQGSSIWVFSKWPCLSSLYKYAKENSGPLKPGIDTMDQTVKTVVGLVHHKFDGKPLELLHFLDRKVDDMIGKVDEYVPPTVKQRTWEVCDMANKLPMMQGLL